MLARIKPSPPFVPQNLPPTGHSPVISANLTHASSNQYLSEARCHVAKVTPVMRKVGERGLKFGRKGQRGCCGCDKKISKYSSVTITFTF